MAAFPATSRENRHSEALALPAVSRHLNHSAAFGAEDALKTLCAVLSESPGEGGSGGHRATKGFLPSLVELNVLSPHSRRPEHAFPSHSTISTV